MKKVLFVLTSHGQKGDTGQSTGFYVPEAAHPWAALTALGIGVDFVSPQGGRPPMDGATNPDATSQLFMASHDFQTKVLHTLTPAAVQPQHYQGILFVGGHGAMWDFPSNPDLAQVAAQIYEAGGIVAAVCHGPAALVNLKLSQGEYLVSGKRVAAFTDEEERAVGLEGVVPFLLASSLTARGAVHVRAPNWQENVVVDQRLVTGQNPASATGVGLQMAALLQSTL